MSQHDEQPQLNALDGERGIPSVNQRGPSTKMRAVIVLVLLIVFALAIGGWFWLDSKQAKKQAEAAEEASKKGMVSSLPARSFTAPPPAPAAAPALPGPDKTDPAPAQSSQQPQAAAPAGAPPLPGNGDPNAKVYMLDKSASDVMAKPSSETRSRQQSPAQEQNTGEEKDEGKRGGMATMLSSTRTATRKATFMPNRNFMLAKGAFIDCALQTRLDTTVPGMTACVVTRNIYSDNGKVLLVERGSVVTGEYQSNMTQGMARIFVLWNRIKTPNGVVIPLDSPGSDQLGGSGVPGYVDNHFWQRFGGALMLSLVDDAARGVTSQTNSGSDGSQFNFTSSGEASQNMAAEALKNTINIPPTLYRNQGGQVGIYVARDLDFSGVYDVTAD